MANISKYPFLVFEICHNQNRTDVKGKKNVKVFLLCFRVIGIDGGIFKIIFKGNECRR